MIGADSAGTIVQGGGIDREHIQHFDEANLRGKLSRYLGSDFEMHTAVHVVDGVHVGVIHLLPHRQGFLPFHADGTYPDARDPAQMKTVFREGDIYVRRGTASVRANQDEITRIIENAASRIDSPIDRLAAIEEARFAREQEERLAEQERERLAEEASRSAGFSVRFAFRNSARDWGRVIARNEGPADASDVALEVWGARNGEREEIEPMGDGDRSTATLLRPTESVSIDIAFTFGAPGPDDLRYRVEWTDGQGQREQEGRVPTD